nr:hypothetical protein [Treponemataceae bacterium]
STDEKVTVKMIDSEPVEISGDQDVNPVLFDENSGIYFIGQIPQDELLEYVTERAAGLSEFMDKSIEEYESIRIVIIKIGEKIFAQCF